MMMTKEFRAYLFLTSLVICGLLGSLITAPKLIHFGVDFPFSVIIFSIFTYPIVDCICELWGKRVARQTLWLGLFCQILLNGKWLWIRSNLSVYLGQAIDSVIFVNIVFYASNQKLTILAGSIAVKIVLAILMTPIVYLIVNSVNRYLDFNTLAYKTRDVEPVNSSNEMPATVLS